MTHTWFSNCLCRCISRRYCSCILCCSSCAALRAASLSSSPPHGPSPPSTPSCSARRASCSGTSRVLRCLPNLKHSHKFQSMSSASHEKQPINIWMEWELYIKLNGKLTLTPDFSYYKLTGLSLWNIFWEHCTRNVTNYEPMIMMDNK